MDTLPREMLQHITDYLNEPAQVFMRQTCKFFVRFLKPNNCEMMHAFCKYGYVRLLKRTFAFLPELWHAEVAAQYGQIRVLRWLSSMDCDMRNVMQHASQAGQLGAMQWLHRNYNYTDNGHICSSAARHNHLHCLKWACENNYYLDPNICAEAAASGNVVCLQYVHEQGAQKSNNTCNWAAYLGHLACLKYAIKHGFALQNECINTAAKQGHFHCVKYLHKKGLLIDFSVFNHVISNDYLEIAQWMVQLGFIVQNDHLKYAKEKCFAWLCQSGCKVNEMMCLNAIANNNVYVIQVAMQQGLSLSWKALWQAINRNGDDNSEIVKLLIMNGAEWPTSLLSKDYCLRYPNLFRWCTIVKFPQHAALFADEGPSYQFHHFRLRYDFRT